MKTLKKVLAVVLALAMVLGMAVTASAGFSDAEKITYKEAVEVMSLAGVLNGYPDGTFKPEGTLTRAEAAKMIVYMLGLEGTSLGYKANFGDITGHWAEEPISVAAGLGIVAGMGNGQFVPNGTLTGFQWAKILLCAMGYDAEVEGMLGAGWEAKVAKLIKAEDMDDDIKKFDGSKPVTRETAAQMAFNVAFNGFVGYPDAATTSVKLGTYITTRRNTKFGEEDSFADRLDLETTDLAADAWGRPATRYWIESYGKEKTPTCNTAKEEYIDLLATPIASYTEKTKGCVIYDDLGLEKETKIDGYDNGDAKAEFVTVKDSEKSGDKIGAQGQLVEFYDITPDDAADTVYRVVVVDTYLAKVTGVTAEKLDKKGHVTRDAYVKLYVYNLGDYYVKTDAYEKGDYVLVNVNKEAKATIVGLTSPALVEIVGLAESFEGTLDSRNSGKATHTVEGTVYNDAEQFNLEQNPVDGSTDYTWFLDQYGNLIGVTSIKGEKSYGVVTYIEKVEAVRDDAKYVADITLVDGTELTDVKVANVTGGALDLVSHDPGWETNYDPATKDEVAQDLYELKYNAKKDYYELSSNQAGDLVTETSSEVEVKTNQTTIGDKKLNDETLFIVRSGKGTTEKPYEFEFITGNDNIGKYTKGKVDYVDLDSTDEAGYGYADYVFVIADATKDAWQFVYITEADDDLIPDTDETGAKYYTLTEIGLDGEEVVLKVKAANLEKLEAIAALKGQLAMIHFGPDGYVVALDAVEAPSVAIRGGNASLSDGTYAVYGGLVTSYSAGTLATTEVADPFNLDNETVVIEADGTATVGFEAAEDILEALDSEDTEARMVYVVKESSTSSKVLAVVITKWVPVYAIDLKNETLELFGRDGYIFALSLDKTVAKEGDSVTLTIVKSFGAAAKDVNLTIKYNSNNFIDGYQPKEVNFNEVEFRGTPQTKTVTFTMPAYDVEISAEAILF